MSEQEARYEESVKKFKRDTKKGAEPSHWLREEEAAVARGAADMGQVAWYYRKVRLCKDHQLGPYKPSAAGAGGRGDGGGKKRARQSTDFSGQGDGGDLKRATKSPPPPPATGGDGANGGAGNSSGATANKQTPAVLVGPPAPRAVRRVATARDVVRYLEQQTAPPFLCPDLLLKARARLKSSVAHSGSGSGAQLRVGSPQPAQRPPFAL